MFLKLMNKQSYNYFTMDSALTGGAGGGSGGEGGGSGGAGDGGSAGGTGTGGDPAGSGSGANGGAASASWRDTLPTDIKGDATLAKYNDVNALAAAHINLQKHLGQKGLTVPGQHATDEEWNNVYQALGVPKELKDYQIKFAEKTTVSKEFGEGFVQEAHKMGILPKQAQSMVNWFEKINGDAIAKIETERKTHTEAKIGELRKELGESYTPSMSRALKAVKELVGDEALEYIDKSGMGNDKEFLKFAIAVGNALYKEDKAVGGGESGGGGALSPADAKASAMKIIADSNHPYNLKDHPAHKSAVAEVQSLFAKANA